MVGVRNREEKKKKAHVYSSGGGGGTKGPAVIDKRNQELNCPYCDKIFKQAGRLQEHLKSKHSEENTESDVGGNKGNDARDTASSSSSSSSAVKNTMIDVGSKGGYYTEKSPKMFLLEWCQKEKRPKPRYKVTDQGGGKFGCKVVMSDERNNDKDIVVFLPEQLYSDNESEAQMVAAVVALAKVAGERSMERILPKQYLWVWEAAKKIHIEREEMRQRKEKQKQDTAERRKQQAQAAKSRAPKVVTLSSDKQRMLEGLVKDSQSGSSSMTNLREIDIDESQISKFTGLGFDYEDVIQAYSACGGSQADFNEVLDWMCVNLDDNKLPKKFRSDGKSRSVSIVRTSKSRVQIEDPFVKELMNYGYQVAKCEEALEVCKGDLQNALLYLFNEYKEAPASLITEQSENSQQDSLEEWNQECEALIAIYEDKVTLPDEESVEIIIDINSPDEFLPEWVIFSDDLQDCLDLKLVVRKMGDYPNQLPFIGVQSLVLPQQLLRQITRMLVSHVIEEDLLGTPMIYELVARINDGLQDLEPEPPIPQDQNNQHDDISEDDDVMELKISDINKQIFKSDQNVKRKESDQQIQRTSEKLYQGWLEYNRNPKLAAIKSQRNKLPAAEYRSQVLESVDKFRVVVISGATGCGKTTQVPQFILESFISKKQGGECSIVCTQPRKISAIGVATRVADERGENVGQAIGYHVRLDNKFSSNTRLLFCTTGIMLRRMLGDPECENFTHIVVDEVHERSVDSDLLLLLLKKVLLKNLNVKVVLMSATADADLFAQYFGDICAVDIVSIPGFTHPVRDFFLEDVVELTEFQVGKRSKWAKQAPSKEEKDTKDEISELLDGKYSENTAHALRWIDESLINYELIEKLMVRLIIKEKEQGSMAFLQDWNELQQQSKVANAKDDNGAVLVFLPGMEEINKTMRQLQQSSKLMQLVGRNGLLILPLHGSLPPWQQSKVFQSPPKGCKKIVLATNIAETSITIPDITCVIDCGRVREMAYDYYKGLKVMNTVWVAQAQAKQRRGRAGRVRPGICFKLFSQRTWCKLSDYPSPEILHTALEPLILQVKTMDAFKDNDIYDIFFGALTPPGKPALDHATNRLLVMQALDENEQPTPLGLHLSRLPLDPPVGKMLIFGVLLGCLDPVLTIAAAISYGKPLFINVFEKRDEIDQIRKLLLKNCIEMRSDHLAYVTIYNMWQDLDVSERRDFCDNYFVSNQVLEGMHALRNDYRRMLEDMGFMSSQPGFDNRNSDNARFVKSAVCAGFYPNILRVQHPEAKFKKVAAGSVQIENNPKDLKFFERTKGRTFIHPQSLNFSVGQYESGWMVYTDIVETSKVFVREASMVPIYSLLLFGGQISVQHDRGLLLLDDWATFKAPAKIAVLVKQLREQVHQLLQRKIQQVEFEFQGNKVITAMMELLKTDGF